VADGENRITRLSPPILHPALDTRRRVAQSPSLMKAILLLLIGATTLALTGCENDVPRDPNTPIVKFNGDQYRDDAREHAAGRAMDRDKTAW